MVDFSDGLFFIKLANRNGAREQSVDVEFACFGALSEKFEDALYPAHQLSKESVVMSVDFMDEVVEVVFVTLAEIDEGLYSLIGVCGNILFTAFVDNLMN